MPAIYLKRWESSLEYILTGPESIITNLCNYLLTTGIKFGNSASILNELFSLCKEEVWSELKFGVPKIKDAF